MPSGFEKGDLIDDAYEVIERIGEGGFGDVYRVRQLSMSRDVALKILLQKGEDSEHLAGRFRREVLAVRNLSHPNTVRIFDFSETPDGYLYYTMEYLEGKTLTQRIRETEGVGAEEARDVLVQVLKSLSEAHSRGIVHRDLKPGNVMLADVHGETNFVKVLDFGIAKAAHTGSDDLPEEQLTSSENIVGTLRYMAPEQAKDAPIGPYTDLYTLGLVGLELLTGEKVFAGLSNVQILKEQLSPDPIEIPGRLTRSPLGEVLQRALAKGIDARYQKADSMREELEEISVEALEEADGPERANTVPLDSDVGSERDTDSAETVQKVDPPEESDVDETRPDTGESGPSNPPPIPGPSEQEESGAVEREDSPDSNEIETIPPETGPEDAPAETKATEKVDENQLEKLRESVADGDVPEEIRERAAEGGAAAPGAGRREEHGAEHAAASDSTTEDAAPSDRMVARQRTDTTDSTPSGFSGTQIAAAAGLVGIFAVGGVYLLWSGAGGEGAGGEESAVSAETDSTSIFGGGIASEDTAVSGNQPGDTGGSKKKVTVTSPDSEVEIEVYRDGELLGSTPVEVDVGGEVELSLKSGEEEKSIHLTPDSPRVTEVVMSPGAAVDGDSGPDAVSDDVTAEDEDEEADESGSAGSKSGSAGSRGSGSRSPSPSRGGERSPEPTPTPSPSPEPDDSAETESSPAEPSGPDETPEEDEEEDDGMEVPVFE